MLVTFSISSMGPNSKEATKIKEKIEAILKQHGL
jgi:siroheme synthase (precorrin-2 oxidase/ferrochelatase)